MNRNTKTILTSLLAIALIIVYCLRQENVLMLSLTVFPLSVIALSILRIWKKNKLGS